MPVEVVTCRQCRFQMTINSQRLFDLQERLERLLTEKKVLNSKVISDAYDSFKSAVTKVSLYHKLFQNKYIV